MTETEFAAKNMYGDQPYQRRARTVLPILVRQAKSKKTISYADLAYEVGMPNHRNLNYVLGSIGCTLSELWLKRGADEAKRIPLLQSLVVNQGSGLPGLGMDSLLTNRWSKDLTRGEREIIFQAALADVFAYTEWDQVLADLGLEPIEATNGELADAARFGGEDESEEHKRLKHAIAENPTLVGLKPSFGKGEVEARLPSGDELDVLFRRGRQWVAVEVKSSRSGVADVTRGVFQCVKYLAVLEAWRRVHGERADVRVILALEEKLPTDLVPICNTLEIEIATEIRVPS